MKRLFIKSVIAILLFGTAIYLPSCTKEATPPIVITTDVSGISKTTVSIGGAVTDDGGAEITDMGVCWSTSPNPTISSNKTSNGKGIGSFTSIINGLEESTNYYVRAYATNSAGTSYGNPRSFILNQIYKGSTVPTLTTADVTSITSISAISGGNITDDGGGDIIERGVILGTNPILDIYSDDVTIYEIGIGAGSFVANLSNLNPGTTYYVKAYAFNGVGVEFGSTLRFTTSIP